MIAVATLLPTAAGALVGTWRPVGAGDDGDALIADRIERDGDHPTRTVPVVTGETYASRASLLYRRASP